MVWSSSDHGVFVWHIQLLFDFTCSEGSILKFLNLCIVQSPAGISFDQPDHIRGIILAQYFKDLKQVSSFNRIPSLCSLPLSANFMNRFLWRPCPHGGCKTLPFFIWSCSWWPNAYHWCILSGFGLLVHALLRLHGLPKLGNFWGFSFDHVLFIPSSSSPNYVYFLQPKYFWCFPTKFFGQRSCWTSICWLWWWSLHFMDADHAHDHWTQRSDSCYFIFLNLVLISWGCKKQLITALYSTGAEVISLHHGGEKSKITYHFFEYIDLPLSAPWTLFEDN